MKLDTVKR